MGTKPKKRAYSHGIHELVQNIYPCTGNVESAAIYITLPCSSLMWVVLSHNRLYFAFGYVNIQEL